MARWLQSTVLGVINPELLDLTIAVTDAQSSKSGDACDFWTERLDTHDEQIVLTWYKPAMTASLKMARRQMGCEREIDDLLGEA